MTPQRKRPRKPRPKPREFWIVCSETSGLIDAYWNKTEAKERRQYENEMGFNNDHEVVRVREVPR